MTKLLASFRIEGRFVEVWEKGQDDICPEDGDAVAKAIIAVVDKHFGTMAPDQYDIQIKHLARMAQGWSNVTLALIPFIAKVVPPNRVPEFLGVLFTQMVDDEYDYLRKWEEQHGSEGSNQEILGEQANQAEGSNSPGSDNGPR